VDINKNRLYLPGHLTKNGEAREVPMTPSLRECLVKLRHKNGVARIGGLVFENGGKRINHTYRLVQQLTKDQQIDNFVFHDLRHCAVTNLADAGVDTETIMKIVGHSCVEMFLRYRKVKAERLDSAMQLLDAVLRTVITAACQRSRLSY
jgi:integrase